MPEGRRLWGRLTVLAAAVVAIHLWLLAGVPPVLRPARPPPPWNVRSVASSPVTPSIAVSAPPRTATAPAAIESRARLERRANTPGVIKASPAAGDSSPRQSAHPSLSAEPVTGFLVPPSIRLHYQVTAFTRGNLAQGHAELQWQHDGQHYEALLELRGASLRPRIQRSSGFIGAQGLAPLRFSDKSRSEEAAHFQRDSGKLSFSNNRPDATLEAGAQDRLSVLLQLGAMLAADASRFPRGASIVVQTATAREALPWVFLVEGLEQLQLPGGETAALKLSRDPSGPYDGKLELWLAPGAAYAPVRWRLTQPNGDWVDQQWSYTDSGG